jgi:hypothetical protein
MSIVEGCANTLSCLLEEMGTAAEETFLTRAELGIRAIVGGDDTGEAVWDDDRTSRASSLASSRPDAGSPFYEASSRTYGTASAIHPTFAIGDPEIPLCCQVLRFVKEDTRVGTDISYSRTPCYVQ